MSDELTTTEQAEQAALTPAERERLAEVKFLARKLYDQYHELVSHYRNYEKLSTTDAIAKAETQTPETYFEHLQTTPVEQYSWFELNALHERNPELFVEIWQDIKESARDDVLSGDYAYSKVVQKSPYEMAIYLAIRAAFQDQWQPKNAGEQLLVDQLTQLYCQYLFWLHRLEVRTNLDREVEDGNVKTKGKWKPAYEHSTTPEWIEITVTTIDRFHRLFLRTLRALRDLRRWSVNVNINNTGQVNIGQQQTNSVKKEKDDADKED